MSEPTPASSPSSRPFWIGLAAGVPILAFGLRGVLVDARDTHPTELARWIVGSAIVHDALVLPVVAAVGFAGKRLVPGWAWPAVRWGLMTTAILVVVSRPFVGRYGYTRANPTALDRNYGAGLVVALAVVWVGAAAWAAVARHRSP